MYTGHPVACPPQHLPAGILPPGLRAEPLFTQQISQGQVWSEQGEHSLVMSQVSTAGHVENPSLAGSLLPGARRKPGGAQSRSPPPPSCSLGTPSRQAAFARRPPPTALPLFLFNIGCGGGDRPGPLHLSTAHQTLRQMFSKGADSKYLRFCKQLCHHSKKAAYPTHQ